MGDVAWPRLEWDVVVVGAGPAGIAAACRAAEGGASVLVLDQGIRAGGQIWRHTRRSQLARRARRWLDRLDRSGAVVRPGVTVLQADPAGHLTIQSREGESAELTAASLIVATGARERFLPFPGWTVPGVVGVGGAQALLKGGASMSGLRIVLAGSGPLLLPVAAALARGGAELVTVAEQAPSRAVLRFAAELWRSPAKLAQAAGYRSRFLGTRYRLGTWVVAAAGDEQVHETTLTDGRTSWTVPCDLLCTGYGLVPNLELAEQLGCSQSDGRVRTDAWQRTSVPGVFCAGEPTGIGGVDAAVVQGQIAGLAATGRMDEAAPYFRLRDRNDEFARRLALAFALRRELRSLPASDTVVCRCEDVRFGSLKPEWCGRQAKLYTRAGMGSCQGRVCGPALDFFFNWTPVVVRTPIEPAMVSALTNPVARSGETSESEYG